MPDTDQPDPVGLVAARLRVLEARYVAGIPKWALRAAAEELLAPEVRAAILAADVVPDNPKEKPLTEADDALRIARLVITDAIGDALDRYEAAIRAATLDPILAQTAWVPRPEPVDSEAVALGVLLDEIARAAGVVPDRHEQAAQASPARDDDTRRTTDNSEGPA